MEIFDLVAQYVIMFLLIISIWHNEGKKNMAGVIAWGIVFIAYVISVKL
jgi:hypothetical protein